MQLIPKYNANYRLKMECFKINFLEDQKKIASEEELVITGDIEQLLRKSNDFPSKIHLKLSISTLLEMG